jgi:heat shock protein HtpX
MADAGCVELMRDNKPLANALIKISQDHQINQTEYTAAYQKTPHEQVRLESYIYDPSEAGISSLNTINDLISTHPSLQVRLTAIGFKKRP